MTSTDTEMATAATPSIRSIGPTRGSSVITVTVAGVAIANLLIYLVGRALGGAFTYTQSGQPNRVDVIAVFLLSTIPLTLGLTVTAWLSRRWPVLIATTKILGPVLAVATIWLVTVPAGFDATSTLSLATMHLAVALATVAATGALDRRP